MARIWAKQALLPQGWAQDVRIEFDSAGLISSVTPDAAPSGERVAILLPAPANAHSHAFQRAMAGLTERRGPDPRDTFWTWRQLMFRFLDRLTPDHIQAITAFVQMEMLEAGYATNAEFHYLHHQPDGRPYANIAEMSDRVAAAAAQSGIGLTLLPVLYQVGGCDGRALGAGQVRFGCDPDMFTRLHDGARAALKNLPDDTVLGVAPHSLRAVERGVLGQVRDQFQDGPIHMHLAEQVAEVEEVRSHWGQRPTEWLLDNIPVDDRWCLIHCTQMLPDETTRLAKTKAVAGLCPITESNLGDGIFDGVRWLDAGGATAIGSDSNIRISLSEELRTLDYSQRLRDRSRAALATPTRSTGRRMFDAITRGGAQAAGRSSGAIQPGLLADFLALDDTAPDLEGRCGDTVIDCWVFAGDDRMVTDVWSAGRHLVKEGRHIRRDDIVGAYRKTLKDLRDAL